MYLDKLTLIQFKNFRETEIEFSPKVNCFMGNNGVGKTNLMDAIYYLSFCKSYFQFSDTLNIQHDAPFFAIHGWYKETPNGDMQLTCLQERGKRKIFKKDKKEYERFSRHVGTIPLVMIAPDDQDMLVGGSSLRRKFIDGVISQFDNAYLNVLVDYNKAVEQRNKLLKFFAETRSFDDLQLSVWDEQLARLGTEIFQKRDAFLSDFLPIFQKYYATITDSAEKVDIIHHSQLHDKSLENLLRENRQKDLILQYTAVGTHRDDLLFLINEHSAQKFASQGQQKSFVLALRLAQFEYTTRLLHSKPLLILDDIFDKLDMNRIQQLIDLVGGEQFGQVFLTDTQPGRVEAIFGNRHIPHKIFHLTYGQITLET